MMNDVLYYKDLVSSSLHHHSFAWISNHMQHDTIAVYAFQQKVLNFIQKSMPLSSSTLAMVVVHNTKTLKILRTSSIIFKIFT